MTRRTLRGLKWVRVASQLGFFGVFLYVFVRSLDPFAVIANPYLRYDPLIFLTNPRVDLALLLPLAGLLAATLLLGRFFCGWVCPMGSLIELSDVLLAPLRKLNPLSFKGSRARSLLVRFPPAFLLLGVSLLTAFGRPAVVPFLHPNVWIVRIFSLSALGLGFLGAVLVASVFGRRLWCTYLCPLGALYGLLSRVSILRLRITSCTDCGICERCPMAAADHEARLIIAHQCILCFDYEHRCPSTGFSYGAGGPAFLPSRRRFLASSAGLVGGVAAGGLVGRLLRSAAPSPAASGALLRPPGVIDEATFLRRCLRCLHCVESCPNGIIKPTGLESGLENALTPHLDFGTAGCDYWCQVCQLVCPNQAIPRQTIEEKQATPIGLARIDEEKCVVFKDRKPCAVCEEVCPTPEKAVVFREGPPAADGRPLKYPTVVGARCIGCGICLANCPADEVAITVRKGRT